MGKPVNLVYGSHKLITRRIIKVDITNVLCVSDSITQRLIVLKLLFVQAGYAELCVLISPTVDFGMSVSD